MTKLKIYIVEDDDEHFELAAYYLSKHEGVELMGRGADGEEAKAWFEGLADDSALHPDLILLDINIPMLNGLELLKLIKSEPRLASIPTVAFTTSESPADRNQAYRLHVNSYLVKPIDPVEFERQVAAIVEYWGRWNNV